MTDLTNQVMPIVRYSIGDIGYFTPEQTQTTKQKLLVLGRKVESFHLESGKYVYARQMQNLFFAIDEIINFKIERLTAKLYKIQVVLCEPSELTGLAEQLQDILELRTPPKLNIVEFICPESSGKYLAIKDSYNKAKTH
ncbi:hypothetical protein RS130_20260 [Paraglaciecola aquimarina]|uniref:Uncharacterized protein n=1 Tax=Paraglaciecola aquimarina TaxID=1235557 RepID=A0ABU3T0W4_9ALTE|nr:hypothetical protein [Paraglaciecola aquimarina]MDU0355909.1 hypothetical protein [Paraglaciecola aquimarina]